MNHYVYEIHYANQMRYIGVRSSRLLPDKDSNYRGSSKIIPKEIAKTGIKCIQKVFSTRVEAIKYEAYLHAKYDVALNSKFYNQVCQTSTKFDQQGCTKESHKHIASMAHKLTGRTEENTEYIRLANEKRRALYGDNQTAKQVAGNIRMGKWNKGRKNPSKGHSGITNPRFKPWYYITPEHEYVEVLTIPIISYHEHFPDFPINKRAITHRTRDENQHKVGERGATKGWVFGFLPIPTIELYLTSTIEYKAVIQFMGALLGHEPFLRKTNCTGDTLEDMWTFPGIPRKQFKAAATPMLYASSKGCVDLWKSAKIEFTGDQVRDYNKEILMGDLSVANAFKDFIVTQVKPQETMEVKIWDEVFTINCNRYRLKGDYQVRYNAYDTKTGKVQTIYHTHTHKEADLEQFKRYFVTLLIFRTVDESTK